LVKEEIQVKMDSRKEWSGKKVLVIGAARQGMALARHLASNGAFVLMNDQRSEDDLQDKIKELAGLPVSWVLGSHPLEILNDIHLVCPSGGVPLNLPLISEAFRLGLPFSNDSQIFLEHAPCLVIGITGSAGKTTTTTLVGRMAQESLKRGVKYRRVFVGGNIGQPLIAFLDEITEKDLVVMELSSFQLEIMTVSTQVAAILNITPNHLDRHDTLENYTAAKARILENQDESGIAVLNRQDQGSWSLKKKVKGNLNTFGVSQPEEYVPGTFICGDHLCYQDSGGTQTLLPRSAILLRGEHNIQNVLAACAICAVVGVPAGAMLAGLEGFVGVDHRLQFVRRVRGVDWYNDSIATTPERAMASILSFDEPIVLLAGGRDKNLPWEDFARLVRARVDHLILFGDAAPKIEKVVGSIPADPGERLQTVSCFTFLRDAVSEAVKVAQAGDVVLLAPGGTSFDEFRDFEERGEWFKKWVNETK
jgi:UDP-N-acetylmuramoylalanine--D-glutamate ligase